MNQIHFWLKVNAKKTLFLLVLLYISNIASAKGLERYLVVVEPAANIRSEPVDAAVTYLKDNLQETQVLYNEVLLYKEENSQWYYVEASGQKEFSHNNSWQGYPGWIRKKSVKLIDKVPQYNFVVRNKTAKIFSNPAAAAKVLSIVSIGTQFEVIDDKGAFYKVNLADNSMGWLKKKDVNKIEAVDKDIVREEIVAAAKKFLGTPYLWGGRSMYIPKIKTTATGVDCSGLTSLSYRVNNIAIPRDAYEQWLAAEKISPYDLKTADLIFLSRKDKFESIGHVMLFINKDEFIESSGKDDRVVINSFKKRFGMDLRELEKKDFVVEGSKLYFGRIKDLIQAE